MRHLETLRNDTVKRLHITKKRKMDDISSSYEQYNWIQLFDDSKIEQLSVSALDKYIDHHQLGFYLFI